MPERPIDTGKLERGLTTKRMTRDWPTMLVLAATCAFGRQPAGGQTVTAAETAPAAPAASISQNNTPALVDRSQQSVNPHFYALGIGDVIRVTVFEEPQFNVTVVIRPDGKISLPLVSEVSVAGLTPVATEQLLATKVAKFVKQPQVTVTVQEIHSRVVYVTGEVLRPGAYALADTINVVQLIARAGGATTFAKKKDVYVLHAGSGLRTKVDYRKVLLGEHVEQNVQLNPGDTVVVP